MSCRGSALADALGEGSIFVRTDLTSDDDIEACIRRAVEAFGRLDFVVNSTGIYIDNGPDTSRAEWLEMLKSDLRGAISCGVVPGYQFMLLRWALRESRACLRRCYGLVPKCANGVG